MPAIAVPAVPLGSVKVKMDERKRAAPDDLTSPTPSAKRQAVTVNGASAKPDDDFPGREDIDRYQKDAILRQMHEYKREKIVLEQQLAHVTKRSEYHDEHLRIIDAWFLQLLDEISLLCNTDIGSQDDLRFSSSLIPSDKDKFSEHLGNRSDEIKATVSKLISNLPPSQSDSRELQERVSSLLAMQKKHTAEMHRIAAEKDQLDERLFNATTRYMSAEKALDRAKSVQVAKLEAQARASNTAEGSHESKDVPTSEISGPETGADTSALESAKRQAIAVSEKQKEQLDRLAEDNQKLTTELTSANVKLKSLTDDDYANTELFKYLKGQHGEVIKRINDLEAKNVELREEAKRLHAERTAYREEADNEIRNTTLEIQGQLSQTEADLARIRSARDELLADLGIRKATAEQQRASVDHLKELCEARETRISALESEIKRLTERDEKESTAGTNATNDTDDVTTIRSRLRSAENEKTSLEQELRSMESAWRKASTVASKKVADVVDAEERIARISTDKAKADQKYFAAMKLKEAREYEIKALKAQNVKSSEIVSQLKDAESSCRALVASLEKQLAEANASLQTLEGQYRAAQQSTMDHKSSSDQLITQTAELKVALNAKDESILAAQKGQRSAEAKAAELQANLDASISEAGVWKAKVLSNSNEDFVNMRKLCWCTVCDANIKNTVLAGCRHVLCKECVDKQIALRARRCPICGRTFGTGPNDILHIQL